MSDEIKEIVDVVKGAINEATEGLATAEALEAVKSEIPSVEGFVKSEEVAELVEKMEAQAAELEAEKSARAELEATVMSANTVEKTVEEEGIIKWESADHSVIKNQGELDIEKAFNSGVNITGAATGSQRVFHSMVQPNVFRGLSTLMPTTATAVNLPQVSGITAQHEANIPANINTGTGHGGTVTSEAVIPQNWTSRTVFSDASVEDLPGLDPMVASMMIQQLMEAEAMDMVGQLDGSTITEVNTGAAAALPDGLEEWASLVSSLSSAYKPNARFVMSREALESLRTLAQQGTGSPLVIDPSTGDFRLWGYGIMVNDYMDAGSTAGDNAVYFGDFSRGTIIVSRKSLVVSRHEDTIPGGVYFRGNQRSRGTAWDTDALRRFNTAA